MGAGARCSDFQPKRLCYRSKVHCYTRKAAAIVDYMIELR
jgi:hypothetical protein